MGCGMVMASGIKGTTMKLELPRWYDLHAHFRQGAIMGPLVSDHIKMGCAGILAMPNTKPPVSRVSASDPGDGWTIDAYLDMLKKAGGDVFDDIIAPLYLTAQTTPAMIESGAKSGTLRAAKYYPPHGTTGSEFGAPFQHYIDNGVFAAMAANNVVLNIHGEEHGLSGEAYFGRTTNAEEFFYKERLPKALDKFADLRVVGEHVTTRIAVDTIAAAGKNVAATITPQHLLYTAGHLLQGFKYHLYCLPLIKFEQDRDALRAAVTASGNTKFFAGTDSAPHAKKLTPCGCAAGCYTGGIAPQLYAQAFEESGADVSGAAFKNFLCLNGPAFYNLKMSGAKFTLERASELVIPTPTPDGPITPLPLGMTTETAVNLPWRVV
jgi:dihydroorotase